MPLVNAALVHSGLVASLEGVGWYPSTVIIKEHDGTVDGVNAPVLDAGNWDPVDGLDGLKGRLTPFRTGEFPSVGFTRSEITHLLDLNGAYPTILPTMRADVDGTLYEINGPVEQPGEGTYTRVSLKLVTT